MILSALIRRQLRRFACDRGGGPALEFALTAPLLALLILGIVGVGLEVDARTDAREAVRAGAHAVMAGETDTNVIRQIVLDALDGSVVGYDVQVTHEYRCSGSISLDALCGLVPAEEYIIIDLTSAADAAYHGSPPIDANLELRVA
jgi:Flp pilus assembly protein TadG